MDSEAQHFFQLFEQYIATTLKWVSYITGIATIIGLVAQFFQWGNTGPFAYLKENYQIIWLVAVTAIAFFLLIWTLLLRRRFMGGFKDNFKGHLQSNWDFEGQWRIPEKGTLLVTGPQDAGGITKVGVQWENYTFSFKARIIRDCLGVVVRAQDLSNYYMFQIRIDSIRMHRRAAIPMISKEIEQQEQPTSQMQLIKFNIGWQIFDPPTPLNRTLNGWFDFRITVRGESVLIYIDDNLALQTDSFLKIPTGKVGFRNYGSEEALVKNVKVTLLQ